VETVTEPSIAASLPRPLAFAGEARVDAIGQYQAMVPERSPVAERKATPEKAPRRMDRVVHIMDDPESRIHFLEEMMGEQGWQARIYLPGDSAEAQQEGYTKGWMKHTRKTLEKEGFLVVEGKDEHGTPVLDVHRAGKETNYLKAMQDLGLAKGAAYTLQNFTYPLGQLIDQASHLVKYCFTDVGRFFAFEYMIGDIVLEGAGHNKVDYFDFGKHQEQAQNPAGFLGRKHRDPHTLNSREARAFREEISGLTKDMSRLNAGADKLQGLAGTFAKWQSIVHLFNRQTHEILAEEMKERADEAPDFQSFLASFDDNHVKDAAASNRPEPVRLWNDVRKSLYKNSFNLGSQLQVAGQTLLMVSGIARFVGDIRANRIIGDYTSAGQMTAYGAGSENHRYFAEQKKMGKHLLIADGLDVVTGICSITGWICNTLNYNPYEEVVPWSKNPVKRFFQDASKHPTKTAALACTAATIAGITAGVLRGNGTQALGNSIYLIGDVAMYMVDKEKYGGSGSNQNEEQAKHAVEMLKAAPFLLDHASMEQLGDKLAIHLARQSVMTELKQRKISPDAPNYFEELDKRTAECAAEMKQYMAAQMTHMETRLDEVVLRTADVVSRFPEEKREMLTQRLAMTICNLPAASVEVDDFVQRVQHSMDAAAHAYQGNSRLVQLKEVQEPLQKLAFAIPQAEVASTSMLLLEALKPALRITEKDAQKLEDGITAEASNILELPVPARARAAQAAGATVVAKGA
jgi:hypothetical protein